MIASEGDGRYGEAAMREAMREIAHRLAVPAEQALLLRLTNNAVFALPGAGVVIRITRSRVLGARVHKVARLGAWFAEREAPTIRLALGLTQPIPVGDLFATVWEYLPPATPVPTVEDLGYLLRRFHGLGPPPFPLPVWDPVGDARTRLTDAEALPDDERGLLLQWCARLDPLISDMVERSPAGLVHGDAHIGNLLRHPGGGVVIGDFDATCTGPWQADLAAVPVGEARFGRHGTHAVLARAYGHDITRDADWPLLRQARELKMVCAAVPLLTSTPGIAEEFHTRLRSIRDGDQGPGWTPYADIRG